MFGAFVYLIAFQKVKIKQAVVKCAVSTVLHTAVPSDACGAGCSMHASRV